jgi:hypothetical protein
MKPHLAVPATAADDAAALAARKTLLAADLSRDPAARTLWRRGTSAAPEAAVPGVAESGFASPMGYWLSSPALPTATAAGNVMLTFVDPRDDAGPVPAALATAPDGVFSRPVQTLRVKSPNAGEGDATLTIGPGGARVVASAAAWKTLAEPVLLAACQYWRFAAIESEITRLTERAHGDLEHSNMPSLRTLRDHKRLERDSRDARALMIDLPHFQGPLSDPLAYLSNERATSIYESIAEKLRLEEWSELIDDRAEAVEDAYEALAEKLFEYKNFAWEAVLEILIIVILLGELALMLYENFGPD